MKKVFVIALAGVASFLSGCFSLDTADVKMTNEEHVLVRNYGWQLFNCIPLFCGNGDITGTCPFIMFRDDVTMERVQDRFAAYADGREIKCPVYNNTDSVFFDFFGWPIPYILCYKEVSMSGTMEKRGGAR